jgi:hypothetical protein
MKTPEAVAELRAAPFNPRQISDEALESLKKSMVHFGDLSGIVFNRKTGNLVGGHQRIKHLDPKWKIMKSPCKDSVGTVSVGNIVTPFGAWQYREVDWPLQKEKAANIAANKHGGEWDIPKLKDILVELDGINFDLELTGYTDKELEDLIAPVESSDAELLKKIRVTIDDPKSVVEKGDVFELGGKHTLAVCDVFSEWPVYCKFLKEGSLLLPFPGPFAPLTLKAQENVFVMVQPEPYIAGHILDRFKEVHGKSSVVKKNSR